MEESVALVSVLCIASALFWGYLIRLFNFRRCLVKTIDKLPSMKLHFYHLFGHLNCHGGIYRRIFKKYDISMPIYDFSALTGYLYMFSKNSISNIWQLHLPFVITFKADSVEVILSHSTELKKAWFYELLHPWLGQGLLTSGNEKWKARRKMLTPAFHFNILKDFLFSFNHQSRVLVDDVLDKQTDKDHVNIVPIVTSCSLDIICESILGAEMHTQTKPSSPYVTAIVELTSLVFDRMQSPWIWNNFLFKVSTKGKRFMKHLRVVDDFTIKLIRDKKRKNVTENQVDTDKKASNGDIYIRRSKAFLDLLLEEHFKNPEYLDEEAIRDEVNTFAFEGHDTTSTLMSWCFYLIGLHPWVQSRIHEELDSIFGEDDSRDTTMDDLKEMKYLDCVIKETLRLYPSVPAFGRLVQKDISFQGYTIPKGSTILVNAYQLHRDPQVFPNPEKFDPDRFTPENTAGRHPYAYVPFSAGPRNCIGQRFALLETKTVLSSVLKKYKVRSLDPRDKVFPLDELVLRSAKGLRLQVRRRKDQDFDFHHVYYRA